MVRAAACPPQHLHCLCSLVCLSAHRRALCTVSLGCRDFGVCALRDELSANADVLRKIVSGVTFLATRERMGELIDRMVVAGVCRMVDILRLFAPALEPALHAASTEFYEAEGRQKIVAMDIPHYLAHVELRLAQEVRGGTCALGCSHHVYRQRFCAAVLPRIRCRKSVPTSCLHLPPRPCCVLWCKTHCCQRTRVASSTRARCPCSRQPT
ncbi:hypothetical protein EON64_05125 [archaeon]|nr:MAG: hypothetical protein EON64_05125 [archaeon]